MTNEHAEIIARLDPTGATDDPQVEAHLAHCADCRALRQVIQQMARTSLTPNPQDLACLPLRLRSATRFDRQHGHRKSPWRNAILAGILATATTAAVGLIFKAAFFSQGNQQVLPTTEVADEQWPVSGWEEVALAEEEDARFVAEEMRTAMFADDDDLEFTDLSDASGLRD